MPGEWISHFRIADKIGVGGMGEVYRATDTKLGREVAIKVLPPQFSQDAQRWSRFEKEARSLAALSHPNILVIHDSGVHEGQPYFVGELLEGRSLREEINRGPVPLRKAVDYAFQITQGLAAAHSKGFVHRDLKPENVFVTRDGRVKILDFGLVKLREPTGESPSRHSNAAHDEEAPTLTAGVTTEAGRTLGTPQYMSPEQVSGGAVDHRTDIFALGCVLHEMLTGERCFKRNSVVEIMTAILKEEAPDLLESDPNRSPGLVRIICRCLEKPADRRFQSALDLGFALENLATDSGLAASQATGGYDVPYVSPSRSRWTWAFGGLVLGAVLVSFSPGSLLERNSPSTASSPLRKIDLHLPTPSNLDSVDEEIVDMVISPDGRKLVYVNSDGLWLRWLDRNSPVELLFDGKGGDFGCPFWSPNSDEIAYLFGENLYRHSIVGGEKKLICATGDEPWPFASGGSWFPDDRIFFTHGNSDLMQVSAHGGMPEVALKRAEQESGLHYANPLPEGRGVLSVIFSETTPGSVIQALMPDGERKTLFEIPEGRIGRPVYSPSGHVFFDRWGGVSGVWAFPFDLKTCERTGPPFLISERGWDASFSDDGTLLINLSTEALRQLVWINRSGEIAQEIGSPLRGMVRPRLSHDGLQIASSVRQDRDWTIWVTDVTRGNSHPALISSEFGISPFWFPGGQRMAFRRWSRGLPRVFIQHFLDDAGEQEQFEGFMESLSRSGKYYLLTAVPSIGFDYTYVDVTNEKAIQIPFPQRIKDLNPQRMRLSFDDRLLAFGSSRSGKVEIYVADFPSFANHRQVSQGSVDHFAWHPSKAQLYYTTTGESMLMSLEFSNQNTTSAAPSKVLDIPEKISTNGFQVSQDGERFLMLKNVPEPMAPDGLPKPKALLVENWLEEFRR